MSNTTVDVKVQRTLTLPQITLTVDAVREGLTVEQIATHAEEIGKVEAKVSAVRGTVLYFAALETHAVMTHKAHALIGKGKGKGTLAEGALWRTKGDYAAAIGRAPSTLSLLENIGRAVVVHGEGMDTTPGSNWQILTRFGTAAAVTRAVEQSETSDYEAAMDALREEVEREGRVLSDDKRAARIASEREANNGTGEGDGSVSGEGGDTSESEQQSSAVKVAGGDLTVKQLCDLLAVKVAQMNREQFSHFEDWTDKVRAANVKRLAKQAEQAKASA